MTVSTRPAIDLKAQVLSILERHEGIENAVMSLDLAEYVGLERVKNSQRKLQIIIRELRKEGKPVLSNGDGYYFPATWAEVVGCLDSLKSRLIEDAKTRRDIKKGAAEWFAGAERARLL